MFCDVIIGDYNHLFDPTVYLRRFLRDQKKITFSWIDEAHNLVNRSKEMYSAEIRRSTFKDLRKQLPMDQQKLRRALNKVEKEFSAIEKSLRRIIGSTIIKKNPMRTMNKQLAKLAELMKEWLPANP